MSKLVVAIVLMVVAALGAWFFVSSRSPDEKIPAAKHEVSTSQTRPAVSAKPASVATKSASAYLKIFTQPGSHECLYEQVASDARSRNIIRIAGGKMRGEFRTATGPEQSANLMVYDGKYLYTWSEGMSTGKKTLLTSLSQLPKTIPTDLTSGASFGTSLNSVGWDCHAWLTDPAQLVPPPYVTF